MPVARHATIDTTRPVTLALDAMGGDQGCAVVVAAARRVVTRYPNVSLLLVGDEQRLVSAGSDASARLLIRHADQVVAMDEPPADALRRKKRSSMRLAIDAVHDGTAAACVSAGNTGALMATAKFVLKTLPGIDRPAIMAAVPGRHGTVHLLDVGANVSCTADQLYQFAVMGSVVAAQLMHKPAPRVGLLNIGAEQIKGSELVRDAARLLASSGLNYVGYVEGNSLFDNVADVVVTDGFTGNVALKTMEGTATLVGHFLRQSFRRNWLAALQGVLAGSSLRAVRAQLDPRAYNGASLVGLNGIVIKSHGGADAVAFEHAIETALLEVQDNVPAEIERWLKQKAN